MYPEITDPQELELPVRLQPATGARVWATSSTHAGFSAQLTVNRVLYDVRLDLHLREGEWGLQYQRGDGRLSAAYEALIMSRANYYAEGKPRDPSWAAREKALDELVPWFTSLLVSAAGDRLLRAAEAEDIRMKQAEIDRELAEVRARERELVARRKELVT